MNKEYLTKIFNDYKSNFLESSEKIESVEKLQDYIIATIVSNIEYDFDIHLDGNKLLNMNEQKNDIESDYKM